MKSYEIGLLQARAYRILRKYTKQFLTEYEIDDIEWSILGLIYKSEHLTTKMISQELEVEEPFVTKVNAKLVAKGFVRKINHESDKRSFYYSLTDKGNGLVQLIEPILMNHMKSLLQPISIFQLKGYIATLNKVVNNHHKN